MPATPDLTAIDADAHVLAGVNMPADAVTAFNAFKQVLFDDYARDWGYTTNGSAWPRIARTFAAAYGTAVEGGIALESHVTAAMAALTGPGEEHLVRFLCDKAAVDYVTGMRLFTVWEMTHLHGSYSKRANRAGTADEPDFVIGTVNPDADGGRGSFTPALFIEVKRSAAVSWGPEYCNNTVGRLWSTQMDCYPHGCWLVANDADAQAAFDNAAWLWIGAQRRSGHELGPWGPAGMTAELARARTDDEDEGARRDAALMKAREVWKSTTLEELAETVRRTPVPDSGSVWVETGKDKDPREVPVAIAVAGYAAFADFVKEWAAWGH